MIGHLEIKWNLILKRQDIWICFKENIPEPPLLAIGDDMIDRVKSFKLLGLWCSNSLK